MLFPAFPARLLVCIRPTCIRPPGILPSLAVASLLAPAPAVAIALSLMLGLLSAFGPGPVPTLRLRLALAIVALPRARGALVTSAPGSACRRSGLGGRDRGWRFGSGLALEPAEHLTDDRRALVGVY